MEEILASIRRIIADEDTGKPAKAAAPPAPKPAPPPVMATPPKPVAPPPKPPAATNNQNDIDAMLADLDGPPKVAVKPAPPVPPPAVPAADVLDLTEAMTAAPPAASFRTIDAGADDVVFTDRAPEPPPEPAPPPRAYEEPRRPTPPSFPDQGLISGATMSAVDNAFNSLANTVLGNNARTLEDLVKEMLLPMLKNWLDDNLPTMVERIVRAEIERVSRGRN
jgi:cell pole-organizing protein PopZ